MTRYCSRLNKYISMLLCGGFLIHPLYAKNSLLYFEAQGVGGYSSFAEDEIWYSHHQMEAMQKPSAGVDYIQRLSSAYRSWGLFAFQGRLAYDESRDGDIEFQIYNAYLKYKFDSADVWIGHNKPSFGLGYYLDTHGYLLQTLVMEGFGFDRDWGAGISSPYENGEWAFSVTAGSGFPLYLDKNYLLSSRVSYGILEKNNYTMGLSASYGRICDTMGYHKLDSSLHQSMLAGVDCSWNINNIELKYESIAGEKEDIFTQAHMVRMGMNFLEENKLNIEIQPVVLKAVHDRSRLITYAGISYTVNADTALRGMYSYDERNQEYTVVGQLYFYKGL